MRRTDRSRAWGLMVVLLTVGNRSGAADKPVLRIDPGAHVLNLEGLAFTPDGKGLLSAARDGTTRLWEVPSLALIRTFRQPVGQTPGHLAVSPDSRLVAVGQGPSQTRIFDLRSGALTQVLVPPDGFGVSFSPDGGSLAIGGPTGPLVWSLGQARWQSLNERAPERVSNLAWSPDGRWLVTSHASGTLLLWPAQGGRNVTLSTGPGPVARLAWSSDGRFVATCGGTFAIDLWDVAARRHARTVKTAGACYSVALDRDGLTVWTNNAGRQTIDGYLISDGRPVASLPAGDPVSLVAVSPDGGLVAGGDTSGGVQLWDIAKQARLGNVAGAGDMVGAVGWSHEGTRVAWTWWRTFRVRQQGTPAPWSAAFNVPSLAPERGGPTAGWRQAELERGGRRLVKVDRQTYRVVGGPEADFRLSGYLAFSAAFLPGEQVAIGSQHGVWVFDLTGRQLRFLAGPSMSVQSLAVSPDERYLLGGGSDQTLTIWPLAAQGPQVRPLLTLYPASNGEWIAWTDEGYYACSPGAEKWVGWQLDHGDKNPDFYPAYQFRSSLYRPDVIGRLLKTGSLQDALREADAERRQQTDSTRIASRLAEFAPPSVEILEPRSGMTFNQPQVSVRVRLSDPNQRVVTTVVPLLDGRTPQGGRFVFVPTRGVGEWSTQVTLAPGENTISLLATNDAGAVSLPVNVTVIYRPTGSVVERPRLCLVAVGVSAYARQQYALRFAAKDARDFAFACQAQEGRLFRSVESKLLTDAEARRQPVLEALAWLRGAVTQRDYGVVFLAGHGVTDQARDYYFLPQDGDVTQLEQTGVKWSDVRQTLQALPGKAILILDTCHAAAACTGGAWAYNDVLREAISDEVGLVTLSSCLPHEVSFEQEEWSNGAFTKALVEALNGRADYNHDRQVSLGELDAYIANRVDELTGGRQHAATERPSTIRSLMPLAMVPE